MSRRPFLFRGRSSSPPGPTGRPPLNPRTWLELDRVRAILSCLILACLLALIIVAGRTSLPLFRPASFPAPHATDQAVI